MLNTRITCESSIKGTGLKGCQQELKRLVKIILFSKGTKFDKLNDSLDSATIDALVQSGDAVILPTHQSTESQKKDATYEELTSGIDVFVKGATYGWLVSYDGNICLGNGLYSLSSKTWDLAWVDIEGKILLNETADGFLKGFSTSLVRFDGITDNDGSVSSKNQLKVQLDEVGSKNYESNRVLVTPEFDAQEINGIVDVSIELDVVGSTTASFNVVVGCDGSTQVDIPVTNFKVVDAGGATVGAISGENPYNITGLTASTDYQIVMEDGSGNGVVVFGGEYFDAENQLLQTTA